MPYIILTASIFSCLRTTAATTLTTTTTTTTTKTASTTSNLKLQIQQTYAKLCAMCACVCPPACQPNYSRVRLRPCFPNSFRLHWNCTNFGVCLWIDVLLSSPSSSAFDELLWLSLLPTRLPIPWHLAIVVACHNCCCCCRYLALPSAAVIAAAAHTSCKNRALSVDFILIFILRIFIKEAGRVALFFL